MILNRADINRAVKIYLAAAAIAVAAAGLLGGPQQAVSAFVGMMVLVIGAAVMVWAVLQAFEKKSFALAGMVIVIKYLLLAGVMYWVCTQAWVSLEWLAAGVGCAMLATLVFALQWQTKNAN